MDIKDHKDAACHPDGKPGNVKKRIAFLTSDLPRYDLDITPYEGRHESGGMPERMASLIKLCLFVFLSQGGSRSGLFQRHRKGSLLVETSLDLMVDLIPEVGFQLGDVRILKIFALPESFSPVPNLIFKIKHFYFLD
jgi:hypothetical protein